MPEVIEMPKLSDTMEEGGIASWLKKEGDFVEDGEALLEIETDKATMEYLSPEEGILLKIIVQAGQTTNLNSPIALIGEKDEKYDLDQILAKYTEASSTPEKSEPTPTPTPTAVNGSVATLPGKQQSRAPGERIKSSPLARKVAKAKGLDISTITGSGPGGRVILSDVEHVNPIMPMQMPSPGLGSIANHEPTVVPVSMMRKTIAKRLHTAKNEAPHFYLTVSANMTNLLEWRKSLNNNKAKDEQIKVSVNDLIVFAAAKALCKHPEVNASWEETSIRQYHDVHMAVAVAVQDGLITPVVKFANSKGVREIAAESKELVKKAREGQLKPEEYAGGTFTISNLGMMGIEEFTAIINPPQSAILAIGATIPTPWVNEDGDIVAQPRMKMTMSCDHRVIDGALGATYLQTLVSFLENPLMMMA